MRQLFGIAATCLGLWASPAHAATVYGWLECVAQDSWFPLIATKTIFVTTRVFPVESDALVGYPTGDSLEDVVKRYDMFMDGGSDFRGNLAASHAKAFREELWAKERFWCAYGVVLPQGPYQTAEEAAYARNLSIFPKKDRHGLEIREFEFP
jgi:hypothetical protein